MNRFLRLFLHLPVIALAPAFGVRAIAQVAPFTPGSFQSLYSAVESRGFSTHMPPQAVAALGIQVKDSLPCRVAVVGASGAVGRRIFSIHYNSHQYLIVHLHSGADRWQYLVNDAGKLTVALHASASDASHTVSWRTLASSEAQRLVNADENFWSRWVIDWPLVPR